MYVSRVRYSNGSTPDEISCEYTSAEVQQVDNHNWPSNNFTFKSGVWNESETEPRAGFEYMMMCGADILMGNNGFYVKGFVRNQADRYSDHCAWTLEQWYCSYRKAN